MYHDGISTSRTLIAAALNLTLSPSNSVQHADPLIQKFDERHPHITFDLSDFYPGTVGFFTSSDKMWAIPTGADVGAMSYDQDLFDQYGVSYPEIGWTRDDFLDKALALRDPEAGVFGYGMNRPSLDDALWLVYLHGGQIVDDLQNPTRTTFDDPLNVEALEWYADLLYQSGFVPGEW